MTGPGPYYRPGGWGQPPPPPNRHRWLIVGIGVAFVAVAAGILLLAVYNTPSARGHPGYPYGFGLFGGVFFLFFLLLVLFVIVRVVFWSTRAARYGGGYGGGYGRGPGPGYYGANRPAMIARMRYARGEITREQYDQIMQDLHRPPPP